MDKCELMVSGEIEAGKGEKGRESREGRNKISMIFIRLIMKVFHCPAFAPGGEATSIIRALQATVCRCDRGSTNHNGLCYDHGLSVVHRIVNILVLKIILEPSFDASIGIHGISKRRTFNCGTPTRSRPG